MTGEANNEKIKKICKYAIEFERRRGDVILCFKDKTPEEMLVFVNFPDKISNIPSCVAVDMFSAGHATPDCFIDESKMYTCSHRQE